MLIHENENSLFKEHDNLSGLSNIDKSKSSHDGMFRSIENTPGEPKCLKPNLDVPFIFNAPWITEVFFMRTSSKRRLHEMKLNVNLFMPMIQL